MLERHRPRRLRDRHAVLGAVVGHITDLEAIAGRRSGGRRASRCNAVIDKQCRLRTAPIQAATRNLHPDNAT
jgi:hypothetical protein